MFSASTVKELRTSVRLRSVSSVNFSRSISTTWSLPKFLSWSHPTLSLTKTRLRWPSVKQAQTELDLWSYSDKFSTLWTSTSLLPVPLVRQLSKRLVKINPREIKFTPETQSYLLPLESTLLKPCFTCSRPSHSALFRTNRPSWSWLVSKKATTSEISKSWRLSLE